MIAAAVAVLVVAVALGELRNEDDGSRVTGEYRIDLDSARNGTWLPVSLLRESFPSPPEPRSLAVTHVAVAPDETVAVAVSHVPGGQPARGAIELWDGDRFVAAFAAEPSSFARGLWFTEDGEAIATIGADGRGRLYARNGRLIEATAYFAFDSRR